MNTDPAAGTRPNKSKKYMRKLLLLALLCAAGSGFSCSDKEDVVAPAGPAGSAEMLCGTWGSVHVWYDIMGQTFGLDVDASVSKFTFNSDGTGYERQETEGATARFTWSYDPATRVLRMANRDMNQVLDWYVHSLTEDALVAEVRTAAEGVEVHMIVTYARISGRSVSIPEPLDEEAALCAAFAAAAVSLQAQDMIVLRNASAEEIPAKVLEVGDTHIRYRKYSNPDGPIYSVSRSGVFFIRYENGEKEVFEQEETYPADSASATVGSLAGSGARATVRGRSASVCAPACPRSSSKRMRGRLRTSGSTSRATSISAGMPPNAWV